MRSADGQGRVTSDTGAEGGKSTYTYTALVSAVTNKCGVLGLNDSPDAAACGTPDTTKYLWTTQGSTDSFPARIYEVKRLNGGSSQAEVESQLLDYEFLLNSSYGVPAARGTGELRHQDQGQTPEAGGAAVPGSLYPGHSGSDRGSGRMTF